MKICFCFLTYYGLERVDIWNNFFKDILPDNWNDPKYDYIYPKAQNKLGLHLPKNIPS